MQTGHPIPLRWTAPEVVSQRVWSTSTDVYSFGIFVSEIYSFGELPFTDLDDNAVVQMLAIEHGPIIERLDLGPPGLLPWPIRDVIGKCISRLAGDRPSFASLVEETRPEHWMEYFASQPQAITAEAMRNDADYDSYQYFNSSNVGTYSVACAVATETAL